MTTTTNLFDPPPRYILPLSRGGDLAVDFRNDPNKNNVYVDYDPGTEVVLTIDTSPPIVAIADINGYHATVKIESETTDPIKADTTWRVVVSLATNPTTEVVAANGKVKRFDA